ncbi:hypothetical protein [uncultured Muribaculum sp.]|uniref:hypothetical protein n=1 Tax=uncultured Muribaculum sp. TaxID=1918613 RepID=UPI0026477BEC|nr:hypothetical protein [uncultured Muribaculum sp.]
MTDPNKRPIETGSSGIITGAAKHDPFSISMDESDKNVEPKSAEAPLTEPYVPVSTKANNHGESDEVTGVENVSYDVVTNAGAPVNPTTKQQAQHQALSLASTQDSNPAGYDASNYAELIEQLQQRMAAIKPLSEEDLKKLRRRQAAQKMIAGISDLGRAIANIYYTSQYAPNAYSENSGLSEKLQARFDKAKAERDANDDRFLNYALQLGKARDAVEALRGKERQQNISLQLKMNEDARRQAKAKHDAEMADIDLQIRMGKLDYEGARARKAAAEARLAEAYAEHADERVMSEINRNNRANRGGSRGGSSRGGNYQIRRRKPDGTYEIRNGFRSAAEARNYVGTHSDEGWEYATTSVRTERTDAYGDTTVTVRNESSTPTSNTDGNKSNEHFNIGW